MGEEEGLKLERKNWANYIGVEGSVGRTRRSKRRRQRGRG